jgi:hypothetical protein
MVNRKELLDEIFELALQKRYVLPWLNAGLAADTFLHVNRPDIPLLFVYIKGVLRAGFHTGRSYTLPALCHSEVISEFLKRILEDLNSDHEEILFVLINQRVGQQESMLFELPKVSKDF